MTSLEDLLRRSLDSEAVRLAPATDPDAAWRELGRRAGQPARRRRHAAGLGVGVTAVGAATAVAFVATPGTHDNPQRPTASVPLGPAVRSLPRVTGTDPFVWTSVSFGTPTAGWAAGAVCGPSQNADTCHPLLARTTDAGRTWQEIPSPLKYATEGYGGSVYATSNGLYLSDFPDDTLWFSPAGGGGWTVLQLGAPRSAPPDSIALRDGAGDLSVIHAPAAPDAEANGMTCGGTEEVQTIRDGRIVATRSLAAGPFAALEAAADGSVWRSSSDAPCISEANFPATAPPPPARTLEVAAASGGYGRPTRLPTAPDVLAPVDSTTAWLTGADGLWTTTDGGIRWRAAGSDHGIGTVIPMGRTEAIVRWSNGLDETVTAWGTSGPRSQAPSLTVPLGRGNGIDTLTTDHGIPSLIADGNLYLTSRDDGMTWHLQGRLPTSVTVGKSS